MSRRRTLSWTGLGGRPALLVESGGNLSHRRWRTLEGSGNVSMATTHLSQPHKMALLKKKKKKQKETKRKKNRAGIPSTTKMWQINDTVSFLANFE